MGKEEDGLSQLDFLAVLFPDKHTIKYICNEITHGIVFIN